MDDTAAPRRCRDRREDCRPGEEEKNFFFSFLRSLACVAGVVVVDWAC
jgi:hypothetical protein